MSKKGNLSNEFAELLNNSYIEENLKKEILDLLPSLSTEQVFRLYKELKKEKSLHERLNFELKLKLSSLKLKTLINI